MKLEFDSVEEVRAFVKQLKGTRGGKNDEAEDTAPATTNHQTAPAPMQPPTAAQFAPPQPSTGFPGAPQTPGAAMGGGFPAPGASPEIMALVNRINQRVDAAIASGQPADAALNWLRGQCDPTAATATMDQIKTMFLPQLAQPRLELIAKQMGA